MFHRSIRIHALTLALASTLLASRTHAAPLFIRGDANSDGKVELSDAIAILQCLFQGDRCSRCALASDSNDDSRVDISDCVYVLGYLFLGGPAPATPFPRCGTDATPSRLTCESYPPCVAPPEETPAERDADLSRLHFLFRSGGIRGAAFDDHVNDDMEPAPRGKLKVSPDLPRTPSWNSIEGRRLTAGLVKIDPSIFKDSFNPEVHYDDDLCMEPQIFFGDPGQKTIDDITIMNLESAFATEYDAHLFLKGLKAQMPFFFPFRHPDVRIGQGWIYSWDALHGAADLWRINVPQNEDATFRVYAPAPGKVVHISWRGGGNTILMEHQAPNGQKYLTGYLHMRNGKSHDLEKALETDENSSDNAKKYKLFAENYSDHISWGTDAQVLQVEVGDNVAGGQFMGWSGNTGVGGASAGLNSDGSPTSYTGNVHLHFSFGVAHPTLPNTYIWIDPFGVYGKTGGDNCYDLLKDTEYERMIAPFYPSFHGLPVEIFTRYFGYYPNMGYGLRTLSLHRDGTKLLCSGSFDRAVDPSWITHLYMTGSDLDQKWSDYWPDGFAVKELNVEKDSGGAPRFTAIWRQRLSGEGVEARANLTTAAWNQKWQDRVVDDGWRVEDYFAYTVNGQELRSSVFTSDHPRPFYFFPSLTSAELSDTLTEYGNSGYVPVNLSAAALPQGTRYSVCLRKLSGCWKVCWGKTAAQYQTFATDVFNDGYRLEKVQGYADSSLYLAVFHRSAVNGLCP